jgi:hypothetical protein
VFAGSFYATPVPGPSSAELVLSFQQLTKKWRAANGPRTMISCRSKYKFVVHFSCKNKALIANSEGGCAMGENIFYVRLDQQLT